MVDERRKNKGWQRVIGKRFLKMSVKTGAIAFKDQGLRFQIKEPELKEKRERKIFFVFVKICQKSGI